MRDLLLSVTFLTAAALSNITQAQELDARGACASLERPNIDCACVAQRVAAYNALSPSATAVAVIDQGYLYALGKENSYEASLESAFKDPMTAMGIMMAYEPLGGRPENVTDYEEGCAISGASKPSLQASASFPALEQYIAGCTRATGDARFCTCDAGRKAERLNEAEFEAYYRSFSDYSDDDARTLDELAAARGKAMDMSAADFKALQDGARAKLAAFNDLDANYCSALLWAD